MKELLDGMVKKPSALLGIILLTIVAITAVEKVTERMMDAAEKSSRPMAQEPATREYVDTRIADLNEKSGLRSTEASGLIKALSEKVDVNAKNTTDRLDAQTSAIKILSDRIYDLARSQRHAAFMVDSVNAK